MEEKEIYVDISRFAKAILKSIWIVIAAAVAFGACSFLYCTVIATPLYTSSTTLYVINTEDFADTISSSDLAAAQSLATSYVEILTSNTTLRNVSESVNRKYSVTELKDMIKAGKYGNTEILQIAVTCESASDCVKLANLVAQEGKKEIIRVVNVGNVNVVDAAQGAYKSSPSTKKITVFGILAGLFLSIVVICIKEMFDTRIKTSEQLTELFGLDIIGMIPQMEGGREVED